MGRAQGWRPDDHRGRDRRRHHLHADRQPGFLLAALQPEDPFHQRRRSQGRVTRARRRQGGRPGDGSRAGRQRSRRGLRGQRRGPEPDHDRFGREARLDLASWRELGRHQPIGNGDSHPGVGLCAVRTRPCAAVRHHGSGRPGHRRAHQPDSRRSVRAWDRRQADDRRAAATRSFSDSSPRQATSRTACGRAAARWGSF